MRARRYALAATAATVLITACGGTTTPPTPKPTSIAIDKKTASLDAVGATVQLTATVKDQNGNALSGQTITWSSDNTASATVNGSGLVTAVKNGTAHVTAKSGSLTDQGTVTVAQVATQITKKSGDAQSGTVGTALAQPFVVQVNDRLAQPVAGVVVSFAIGAGGGSLSAAKDTTDASGQGSVTWTLGKVAGTGQVGANVSGGASATFNATLVADVADSLVKESGDGQSAAPGSALADSIVVRVADKYGNPVQGTAVSFTVTGGGGSVSPPSATSDANGLAATEWTVGSSGASFSVTSVTPDTIVEGAGATINGSGFDANSANDGVTVDGATANVTGATSSAISFDVPAYDCRPSRNVPIVVTVNGSTSQTLDVAASGLVGSPASFSAGTGVSVSHPLNPASFVNLTVGQQTIVQNPNNFCFQFAPNLAGTDQYLIGVGAAAESPTTLNSFTLASTAGLGPVAPVVAAPTLRATTRAGAARQQQLSAVQQEVAERWARQYVSEGRLRAYERGLLQRAPRGVIRGSPMIAGAPQSPLGTPSVGDTVHFRVPSFSGDPCANFADITTIVKAVGAAGIWVSDTANPKASDSLTDAEIQAYSDTFDTKIYATDTSYFGAPSDIDNNGHIFIVLSLEVNKEAGGGVAGFVFSGDLFSRGVCASSDTGEIFYGQVPDGGNKSGTGARTKNAVVFQMPSLIAHEFTHDIQDSRRIVIDGSSTGMAAWEAEGQAMFAQNAVGDDVLGNSSGNNYGWTTAHTGQGQRWYGQGFDLLAAYYGFKYTASGKNADAPEQCSLYADTQTSLACFNFAFYGAAYSFEKYITDRFGPTYSGGEKGLQHDVIGGSPTLAGRANWAALLGLTATGFDSVYSQWSAMLYVDDRVAGLPSALQMTSWNLNGAVSGIFGPGGYSDSTFYLVPSQQAWGAFSLSKSVRDGSNFYTLLSSGGPHAALAVKARDGTGNPLGTGMKPQYWIVRIQ